MEDMLREAGVTLRYYTMLSGIRMDAQGTHIEAIETVSKSGKKWWPAKVFVDTTGDGDLGALAGCRFNVGRDENGGMQPMSLHALVTGIREETILPDAATPRRPIAADLEKQGARRRLRAHP